MDRKFESGGWVSFACSLVHAGVADSDLSAELLRRFHESAGSHSKKCGALLKLVCALGSRFELLKIFLLSDELCGAYIYSGCSALAFLEERCQDDSGDLAASRYVHLRFLGGVKVCRKQGQGGVRGTQPLRPTADLWPNGSGEVDSCALLVCCRQAVPAEACGLAEGTAESKQGCAGLKTLIETRAEFAKDPPHKLYKVFKHCEHSSQPAMLFRRSASAARWTKECCEDHVVRERAGGESWRA